jgi:prophage maintenance system killer protein/prophage antirepressor-like protein
MKIKNEIIIFKTKDGAVKLEVNLQKETVWLDLNQMARLFGRDKSSVSRHISNIFKTKELERKSTVAKFATVQSEGGREVTRNIEHYNLDVIISVGYRINSKIGTQFRIWATNVLKSYLVRGYALDQKRLLEREASLRDLREAISFISSKTAHPQIAGKTEDLLDLLNEYANALTILREYDDKSLTVAKKKTPTFILTFEHTQEIVTEIKTRLKEKDEATELFGCEYGHKLKGIIGALYQTFDKKELYPSVEEKAAHILYLTIKDHPFSDGNKRLASIMFVYYLDKNGYLDKASGGRKITDNTIVALSLLIASSDPREKDMMIKIITNLLK